MRTVEGAQYIEGEFMNTQKFGRLVTYQKVNKTSKISN